MKRSTAVILIILVGVSFIGRVNSFRNRRVLSYDEVVYSTLAIQVAQDPTAYNTVGLYQTGQREGRVLLPYLNKPLFKHPPLFTSLVVASYRVFGTTYNSAFLVSCFSDSS